MSSMPSGGDFNARLQAALAKAKSGVPAGGAIPPAAPPPAAPPLAAPADDFGQRVAEALRRSSGELPTSASALGAGAVAQPTGSGGPVGVGDYVVRQGDCMASIAIGTGHFWETIWNFPANADLQRVRVDPYILLPGDRVTIPELTRKEESIAAEQRHRFKRRGCPEKLIVTFREENEPRANQRYVLRIDGKEMEGTTDPSGRVEVLIPPNAKDGKVEFPDSGDVYDLDLGHLDPITELTGVQGRLRNLGFYEGEIDGRESEALTQAIRAFQVKHDVDPTGELNDETRDLLRDEYGS